MPSFDIVNRIDLQEVDNAVNITQKAILSRYDFRGSRSNRFPFRQLDPRSAKHEVQDIAARDDADEFAALHHRQ